MKKKHAILLACPLILVLVIFSGCATKMSLEEAKKVTIVTGEKSFVPPPRKTNDINDLLNKKGIFKSKSTAEYTRKADMPLPSVADDARLKQFYEDRGIAAYQLGRYKQALEDMRKAYGYLQKTKGKRNVLALNLSFLEGEVGNFKTAINILEEEIQKNPFPWSFYSYLTQIYARTGDIESARNMNRRCGELCSAFKQMHPKSTDLIIQCEAQLNRSDGFLLEAEGKLNQAEGFFRKYADYGATLMDKEPRHAINMRTFLIGNLIQQGKLVEAELETRKALDQSLDLTGKNSALTGRILTLFVNVLRLQGRLQEADILSKETIKILEASGITSDSNAVCSARTMQGNIFFARDDYASAMRVFDQIKADMKENQYLYDKYFLRNLNIMVCLIKTGRAEEARKLVSHVYESNRKIYGDESYEAAESLGIRAMANVKLGKNKEAYNDFSLALATLLKRNLGKLSNPDQRKRVVMVYESYIDFLYKIRGTDLGKELKIRGDEESYKIVTALSSYSLAGAVGESSARAAAAYDPDLADLVRREQDAQKEINVLQEIISDLLSAPSDEVTSRGVKESRTRLNTLTRARIAILEEIEKRFPKYADYVNPQVSTVKISQQNLRKGEALVSIYTTDDKTYIWSVPKSGDVKFAVSPLGKKELTDIVFNLRRSLDVHPSVLGDIPYDVSLAYYLYSKIFKPVENGLKGATDVLAIIRGPLGQLPLAILPTAPVSLASDDNVLFGQYRKVPWLIRKVSITILPSVSSLITLRSLPPSDPKRKAFAGFGDPIFSKDQIASLGAEKSEKPMQLASRGAKLQVRGVRMTEVGNIDNKQINSIKLEQLNRLPDTAAEIMDIANALNADLDQDVFLGKNASEHQIITMNLSNRRIIAFATHALVPGDLDGLDQPALALSSPSVTGDSEDGLLTMGEIMKLKLNADWVVLSACNTGASEGGGTEALTGLGRAFFYAGTRSILASMWPVETTSAKKLVSDIFKNQQSDKTLSRAGALRKSMIGLIDDATMIDQATGKIIASYAHPVFWAPFIIVGDPGGN
jgi:CHAT domain-containing protein